jgi:hypothetical protein
VVLAELGNSPVWGDVSYRTPIRVGEPDIAVRAGRDPVEENRVSTRVRPGKVGECKLVNRGKKTPIFQEL